MLYKFRKCSTRTSWHVACPSEHCAQVQDPCLSLCPFTHSQYCPHVPCSIAFTPFFVENHPICAPLAIALHTHSVPLSMCPGLQHLSLHGILQHHAQQCYLSCPLWLCLLCQSKSRGFWEIIPLKSWPTRTRIVAVLKVYALYGTACGPHALAVLVHYAQAAAHWHLLCAHSP